MEPALAFRILFFYQVENFEDGQIDEKAFVNPYEEVRGVISRKPPFFLKSLHLATSLISSLN
jgi:hypothetical protein